MLDVCSDIKPLYISLNIAHSGCKPISSISSFTNSQSQVFPPLLPLHLHISTGPHPVIPLSNAQTISIYHDSPPQPCSEHPKTVQDLTLLPILQRHSTHPPHHHMLCFLQAMQILSLHCPCLSPMCQHTLDTCPENLSLHVIWCTTSCQDGR